MKVVQLTKLNFYADYYSDYYADFYADRDEDGFGKPGDSKCFCGVRDEYTATGSEDCDDSSATTHPGIATAEADPSACMKDDDGDGWVDHEDPDCLYGSWEVGYSSAECNDGFDNDTEFARWMIEEIGVATVPGSSFYVNPEDGHHLVRFCFPKKLETLHEGAKRLKKLREYVKK